MRDARKESILISRRRCIESMRAVRTLSETLSLLPMLIEMLLCANTSAVRSAYMWGLLVYRL